MGGDRVLEGGGQGGHLHCQYALGDQFAGAATGNADAEDAVGIGVYEQLGHPVVGILGRGAAGGGPGEARDQICEDIENRWPGEVERVRGATEWMDLREARWAQGEFLVKVPIALSGVSPLADWVDGCGGAVRCW